MTVSPRFSIVPVGMSLGTFFVITYLLCVAYGFVAPGQRMHELISMLIPGFTWISWGSFFIGVFVAFGYGWYVALIFIPLYNFRAARDQ
jgi:hypothetical protein